MTYDWTRKARRKIRIVNRRAEKYRVAGTGVFNEATGEGAFITCDSFIRSLSVSEVDCLRDALSDLESFYENTLEGYSELFERRKK